MKVRVKLNDLLKMAGKWLAETQGPEFVYLEGDPIKPDKSDEERLADWLNERWVSSSEVDITVQLAKALIASGCLNVKKLLCEHKESYQAYGGDRLCLSCGKKI